MKKLLVILILVFATNAVFSQNNLLVSGPMLGYIEHREALIWIETVPETKSATIKFWKDGDKNNSNSISLNPDPKNPIVKFILPNLEMNQKYEYEILLENKKIQLPYPLKFKTKELWEHRKPAPDFSFLFGSCLYINDSIYDRPGKPYGADPKILLTMAEHPADFMLWGGDNVYLREADWTSRSGIYYRYRHTRKTPEMQKLIASMPNYAVWDDHDYGPNDSENSFELKEKTLQAFKDYWGNQTYGEAYNPGIYSKFTWSDAEFFILDNRYHRTHKNFKDSANNFYLGEKQMLWLMNSLLFSKAKFKFIVSGSQVLNPLNEKESFRHHYADFKRLMDFLNEHKIPGIIFLSGDRHFSEIIKIERPGNYSLYDITSSSLTAGSFDVTKRSEGNNPFRVSGTLSTVNNFTLLSVSGEKENRKLLISNFDRDNQLLWEFEILLSKLN
jgi:alkaline phosphatase D